MGAFEKTGPVSGSHLAAVNFCERERGCALALASLEEMTPNRLAKLLLDNRTYRLKPSELWDQLIQGHPDSHTRQLKRPIWQRWIKSAQLSEPPELLLSEHKQAGIEVICFRERRYPSALIQDPDPPAVLFLKGKDLPEVARVAIVGTRRCSRYGREVTQRLAASLAAESVPVVSGLADGIDSIAHETVLDTVESAHPIAVVAGGVDHIYPKHNYRLWASVYERGTVISEWPMGAAPRRWTFPARNRLIAALSAVVVVVETAETGGSMHTVQAALERCRPVLAVPGSIFSPVSHGCNRLLAEGAYPLTNLQDLTDALDQARIGPDAERTGSKSEDSKALDSGTVEHDLSKNSETADKDCGEDSWLLELIGWEPITVDDLLAQSPQCAVATMTQVELSIAQKELERHGSVIRRRHRQSTIWGM